METNEAAAAEQKLALARECDRADRPCAQAYLRQERTRSRQAADRRLERRTRSLLTVDSSQRADGRAFLQDDRGKDALHRSRFPAKPSLSISERSSASELPRPEPQATAPKAAPDLDRKVATAPERSTSASAASRLRARTNRGCSPGRTRCCGKPILAALARCLNTLSSVAARELPLCWPRLTTRACCNRGAHAESPVILRRHANYMNGRRQAASRMRRSGSKLCNRDRLVARPSPRLVSWRMEMLMSLIKFFLRWHSPCSASSWPPMLNPSPTRETATGRGRGEEGRHSRERTHQCMDRRSRRRVHRRCSASPRGRDRSRRE